MLSSQEVCDSSSVATNESLPASSSFCLFADGHESIGSSAFYLIMPSLTISPFDNAIFNRLVLDNAILSLHFESWNINFAAFAYACHIQNLLFLSKNHFTYALLTLKN